MYFTDQSIIQRGDPMGLNFEVLERVDEKNGDQLSSLIVMFSTRVTFIKMSQMAHFLYFFTDDS